jgi:hypothetical protein
MYFCFSIRSLRSQVFLELNCRRPQSLTKSQYNWYIVAILDTMTTSDNHPALLLFSYATLVPAASIADTYFPRFTMWFMSPSSNHLLAHCHDNSKNTNSFRNHHKKDHCNLATHVMPCIYLHGSPVVR